MTPRAALCATTVLVALALAPAAIAAEDARGLAAACAGCHGTDGHAVGRMPVLAGRARGTVAQRMRAFRDGRAPATVMPQIARGYREAEIEALDAWFAAQAPTARR